MLILPYGSCGLLPRSHFSQQFLHGKFNQLPFVLVESCALSHEPLDLFAGGEEGSYFLALQRHDRVSSEIVGMTHVPQHVSMNLR